MSGAWKILKVKPTEDALRFGVRVQYPFLVEVQNEHRAGERCWWRLPCIGGDAYDWSRADLSACDGVVPFGGRPGMEHKDCGGRIWRDPKLVYPRDEPSEDFEERAAAEERFLSGASRYRYGADIGFRCALCGREIQGDPEVLLPELEEE